MASLKTLSGLSLVKLQERATRLGIDTNQFETKGALAIAVFTLEQPSDNTPTAAPEPTAEPTTSTPKQRFVTSMKAVRSAIRTSLDMAIATPDTDIRRHIATSVAGIDIVIRWSIESLSPTFTVPGELRSNDQRQTYAFLSERLGLVSAPNGSDAGTGEDSTEMPVSDSMGTEPDSAADAI